MVSRLPRAGMPPPPPPMGYVAPLPSQLAAVPARSLAPVLTPIAAPTKAEIKWRWYHLLVFGVAAFVVPIVLTLALSPRSRVSEFLDSAFYFQIIGYALAAALAFYMVRHVQNGDWTTLGIKWTGRERGELLTGAGYGVVMLGCFLVISLPFQGGELQMDELVRLSIGSTSGLGLVLAAIAVVIGAPLIEETFFRGLLYEKLARRNIWLAVIVTALLFQWAHGAIFIPAILALGFGLAWKRRTRTLWYTMGAHAAWNACILVTGLFLLSGGWNFSPADGSYTIRFPKSWERIDIPQTVTPGASFDVGLATSSGSFISTMRVPAVGGSATATTQELIKQLEGSTLKGATHTEPEPHDHLFDQGAEAIRVVYLLQEQGIEVAANFFVLVRPGSSSALILNITCPKVSCADDGAKFDEAMHGLRFTS